jgi:hypothetical protein
MGTTLTGTTPQDTYDSLIKVTDNGPLTGSLKKLTDGLGNDSSLSLSTAAASLSGTLAVTGNATFDTDTLFVDAANNRVGVGSITPSHVLDIQSTSATLRIRNTTAPATGGTSSLLFEGINNFSGVSQSFINSIQAGNAGSTQLAFGTSGSVDATATERMRITSAGNVGIGSAAATGARLECVVSSAGASPTVALRLQNTGSSYQAKMVLTDSVTNDGNIVYQGGVTGDTQYIGFGIGAAVNDVQVTGSRYLRMAASTGGIQFNGDTAAANALDDYEEGTWTPSFRGTTTAGTYTYSSVQAGAYTKIGNQVTVWCSLIGITASSAGTGEWLVAGLPFTIANNDSMSRNNTTAWIRLANASRSNILALPSQGGGGVAFVYDANSLGNTDFTIASDFSNGLQIGFSFTYFV